MKHLSLTRFHLKEAAISVMATALLILAFTLPVLANTDPGKLPVHGTPKVATQATKTADVQPTSSINWTAEDALSSTSSSSTQVTICGDQPEILEVSNPPFPGGVFLWSLGATPISDGTGNKAIVTAAGTYTVTATYTVTFPYTFTIVTIGQYEVIDVKPQVELVAEYPVSCIGENILEVLPINGYEFTEDMYFTYTSTNTDEEFSDDSNSPIVTGALPGTTSIYTVNVYDFMSFCSTEVQTTVYYYSPEPTFDYGESTENNLTVGDWVSITPIVENAAPPLIFSVTPDLPDGLTLDTETGVIIGTPTAPKPSQDYSVNLIHGCTEYIEDEPIYTTSGLDIEVVAACEVTNITLTNMSNCNTGNNTCPDDDTFTADITVTFSSVPGFENIIGVEGSAIVNGGFLFAQVTSPAIQYVFQDVQLKATPGGFSLVAAFNESGCSITRDFDAPACSITSLPESLEISGFVGDADPGNGTYSQLPGSNYSYGNDVSVVSLYSVAEGQWYWRITYNNIELAKSPLTTNPNNIFCNTFWTATDQYYTSGGVYVACTPTAPECAITDLEGAEFSDCENPNTSEPGDDTFSGSIIVTYENAPADHVLKLYRLLPNDIEQLIGETDPTSDLRCSQTWVVNVEDITADGQALNIRAKFEPTNDEVAPVDCSYYENIGNAPSACSCNLSVGLTNFLGNNTITCADPSVYYQFSSNVLTQELQYSWSGSAVMLNTVPRLVKFSEGSSYSVTVTDPATGCTVTETVSIDQNTTPPSVNLPDNSGTITCSNPTVTLNPTTASTNTLSWSDGVTNSAVTAGGTYTVTVTNPDNGCATTATTVVAENTTPPSVDLPDNSGTITCSNPSVTLNPITASTNTLSWSSGVTNSAVTAGNTYTVTVTNPDNGCATTATTVVTQNTMPPSVNLPDISGTITCSNPSVTLNPITAPTNTLSWSSGVTNSAVTALGIYMVTVTNPDNGCTTAASTFVGQNTSTSDFILDKSSDLTCNTPTPTLFVQVVDDKPLDDFGGGIIIITSPPSGLAYAWSSGVTPNGNSATVNSVAGTYTVTVTFNNNGCTSSQSINVTGTIEPPVWYLDSDGDGFGDPNAGIQICNAPSASYKLNNTDCNDADNSVFPGATEICDGKKNNCSAAGSELTAPCPTPSGLTRNITGMNVKFGWQNSSTLCFKRYRIQYRRVNTTNWTLVLAPYAPNNFTVKMPAAGTYQWGMRGECYNGNVWALLSYGTNYTIASTSNLVQNTTDWSATTTAEVYPNPAKDVIHVKWQTNNNPMYLRLVDQMGRTIEGKMVDASTDNATFVIENIPNGLYFVQMYQSGADTQHKQVVINR